MLSKLAHTLLALTSVAPVAVIYGAAQWGTSPRLALGLFALTLLLWLLCIGLLRYAKSHAEVEPLNIATLRSANGEILSFFLIYLLPLLIQGDGKSEGIPLAIIVFVALLLVIVFRSNVLHVNPLMGIIGYQFYEASSPSGHTFLIVTKHSTNNLNGRKAVRLSPTLLLEV